MTHFFRLFPSRVYGVARPTTLPVRAHKLDSVTRVLVRERTGCLNARLTQRTQSARLRSRARPRSARSNASRIQSTMALDGIVGHGLVGAAVVDFGIQFVGWAIAAALKTEKFYDLFGSLTFITLAVGTLIDAGNYAPRQVGLTAMVVAWALRLGSYLVIRITRDGHDKRFEEAKSKPGLFFVYWSLQGVWVFLTALPVLLVNTRTGSHAGLMWTDAIGLAIWLAGFVIETVADYQKFVFRSDPANKGRFIRDGVWKYSRHPNYFGEILVWWGVYITSLGSLPSYQPAVALASPLFVMALLLYVSGVPMLEKSADERWGDDLEYQEYKANSRELLPLPKKLC